MSRAAALWLSLLAAAPAAAQEPEQPLPAEPPPIPAPAPSQEPVSMEDVLAAIEQLRQTFDLADQRVREAVEVSAPQPADRERGLATAGAALQQLVKDMDALLEILPEPEPPPPSDGSGSSGQRKPQSSAGGEDQRGRDPRDDQEGGAQDQNQGQVPPPTGPPLTGQPPANYGRWGLLPPRLQEALQNSAGTEVPARYRRWLEEYHRRGQQPR